MSVEAQTPAKPPSRRVAAALGTLTVALCLLHGWGVWVDMEGWKGLTSEWPLWRNDHPLYYYSARITPGFLTQSGTTAGYDPMFMAGYAKSVVFPASSTLPELVMAAFGRSRPEVAYKVYVFLAAAIIPWLVAAAGMLWRCGAGGTAAAVALFLLYVWTDFPYSYVVFGMLPYLLAIPLGLVATGFLMRYGEYGGWAWWLASAVALPVVVMVHFTSAMVVAPACAGIYAACLRVPQNDSRTRFTRWRHVGIWAIPVLVLLLNAFWWLPGVWLAGTKGESDFAFAHPEGVVKRLVQIATTEPTIQRVLWILGLVGFVPLLRRSGPRAAGLLIFAAAGFGWGYLAGASRSLDFLQPGRHTYAFYTALCVASGYGISAAMERLRGRRGAGWAATAVLVGLGAWMFGPTVQRIVEVRRASSYGLLASRPSPRMQWIFSRVSRHVKPGERLLYEEGGFGLPGLPDPYLDGRFSGLLAAKFGIELIGGPYLHAALTTNFTQFGEGKLFGKADWDRAHFERYARIYRPEAILCWTPHSRAFCRANPDLIEVKDDDGVVLIGRVRGCSGAAVVGTAEVEARPGELVVRRAEGGVDGTVVLRYHSVPCLRADPPVAWDEVRMEDDPVPFIRLRPPPGVVVFRLQFPPGAAGAPGGSARNDDTGA